MERVVNAMWKPLIKRSEDGWIGVTEEPGIWVGDLDSATGRVDLQDPVCLWPFLERDLTEVAAELEASAQVLEERASVRSEEILLAVVSSALRSGRDYWTDLALGWVEKMEGGAGSGVSDLVPLLTAVTSAKLPQAVRHRARAVLKKIRT